MSSLEVIIPTVEDDRFHQPSSHPWETETVWFSCNVPDRHLGAWFYNQVLPNQGICNGGAWVWDNSSAGALYELRHEGLQLPKGKGDLRDYHFPNGNSVQMIEPLRRYTFGYSDPGLLEATLQFDALMAPHSHPLRVAPFWKGRHLDQAGHVTGSMRLHGEQIEVDCFAVRDRSWGPRPRGPTSTRRNPSRKRRGNLSPFGVGYAFGTASSQDAFLAYTIPTQTSDKVSAGYLIRDGIYAHLTSGHRSIEFDTRNSWIQRITLEATDTMGRDLRAIGQLVSRHGTAGPNGTGLFFWDWNNASGWGEDQTYAPPSVWQALGAHT